MNKRSISILVVAAVATCGVATTVAVNAATSPAPRAATAQALAGPAKPLAKTARPAPPARAARSAVRVALPPEATARKLPAGVSTATSFWDGTTASGKPMSFETVASPYWPLGTRVRITYQGRSTVGVVQDFGPAEWAVAQHNPPAIVDLSEEMMAKLTGTRSNSVTVKFQVLRMGSGRVYRHSGTGYDRAMSK